MSRIHRNLKRMAFLFITLSLSFACFIFSAGAIDTDTAQINNAGVTQTATVIDGGVLLHSEPKIRAAGTPLEAGTIVTLLGEQMGDWQLVCYTGETGTISGYVSCDDITTAPIATGVVASDCEVRFNQPATNDVVFSNIQLAPAAIIGNGNILQQCPHTLTNTSFSIALTAGTEVCILDVLGDWYLVRANDSEGYIQAEYIIADCADSSLSHGTVTSGGVRMRESADAESKVLTTLADGVIIQITDYVDGWYAIRYNGMTGYVSTEYVEHSDGLGCYVQVTEPTLPLMSGVGENYAVLAEIEQGTVLTVLDVYGDWYLVACEGYCGFVNSASTSSTIEYGFYDGVSNSGIGHYIAAYACQFEGNPYQWGGTSLTRGADCSGFVLKVYQHFGVNLPHSSKSMRSVGKAVSYSDIRPGDIVCYSGHVGIYAGKGQIINALGEQWGITYTDVNYDNIITIRRIFD